MIELENVSKHYGNAYAVQKVSLAIRAEETTVLIGPSGSGKSTLLRLMIGLISPDEGRVVVGERELQTDDLQQLRHRMGYVIQEGGLFPHLTGRANITLLARHLGWSDDRINTRLRELTQLVQLDANRLQQYPSELSGGQRQRVSLMRALMLNPDVLLLDEPLGALDPMIRTDLQEDLRIIFERLDKTVVFVTHDIGEAAFFGDHTVVLREGQIEQSGKMNALLNEPASPFVSNFIQAQRSPLKHLSRSPE
jgi:osmoprotectant transport system ATP-binding protein